MGNFTKIKLVCNVHILTFGQVAHLFSEEALNYVQTDDQIRARWKVLEHRFFKTQRAPYILTNLVSNSSLSGKEDKQRAALYQDGKLTINATLKNYDHEIQLFLDWIAPYLDLSTLQGTFESDWWDNPAPLVVKDGKITFDESKVYDP